MTRCCILAAGDQASQQHRRRRGSPRARGPEDAGPRPPEDLRQAVQQDQPRSADGQGPGLDPLEGRQAAAVHRRDDRLAGSPRTSSSNRDHGGPGRIERPAQPSGDNSWLKRSCRRFSAGWPWAVPTRWSRSGFSITFTTTKTLNFSHGEFVSAGAFIGMSALFLVLGMPFDSTTFGQRDARRRRPAARPGRRARRHGRARLAALRARRAALRRPAGHGLGHEHARLRRHPAEHRLGHLGPQAGRRARTGGRRGDPLSATSACGRRSC